jgi:flagellar basal body-associated protein FliL
MNRKKKFLAIGLAALAVIVLAAGLWGALFLHSHDMRSKRENLSIIDNGERTMGTIISKRVVYDPEPGAYDSVYIKYRFVTSSGQELVGSYDFEPARLSAFDRVNVGDEIEIAYDQREPAKNLPVMGKSIEESTIRHWDCVIFTLLACALVTFSLGAGAWVVWKSSRKSVEDRIEERRG